MASKIDIINLALTHLAEQPINAIDEGSESANIMQRVYDISLESEIRAWPYTWATRVAELSQISAESPVDFAYAYQLPADYLQLDRIIDTSTGSTYYEYQYTTWINIDNQEWEIREDKLYVNSSTVTIEYRIKEEDTTKWDPSFVMAFSYKLAELAGSAITENDKYLQRAAQNYIRHINLARSNNGAERNRLNKMSEDYINARNA